MLLYTLRTTQEKPGADEAEDEKKAKAAAAADRIRELRKGTMLDLPQGMSLRKFAHLGHKY
jgi:hypothetical protein